MGFKSVLITVDIESDIDAMISLAGRLATTTGAKFSVLGVAPDFPAQVFRNSRISKTARHLTGQVVDALKEKVERLAGVLPAGTGSSVVSGRLVEEVAKAVLINHADLVMKAASITAGEKGPMFGSIDKRLIRNCPAPVWVVRPDIGEKFDRIAVAIDRHDVYSDSDKRRDLSLSLLDHAAKLASFFDIKNIDVVYAWDAVGADMMRSTRAGLTAPEAEEYMKECEQDNMAWMRDFIETASQRHDASSPAFVPHLVFGRPRQTLVSKVHDMKADVLILGTIARSGALGFLIGNTAEDVLDRVECSVMAIKPATSNAGTED